MAYNYNYNPNYFQQQYGQNIPMPTALQMPQIPQVNQQTGIIWVQGESGAKSYLVPPNTTVPLWDSEEKVIYLKSADASGMPSMKIIDYTIRNDNSLLPKENNIDFVTHDELNKFKSEIKKMIEEVDGV